MRLCVLSGKGGTGKTTFAINLALCWGGPTLLLDCDVEEPDCHIFLPSEKKKTEEICLSVPAVDKSLCDGCGECSAFCQYHAIAKLGKTAVTFPELCHSCGGCALVCPKKAISETERRIGEISSWDFENLRIMEGRMDVGGVSAPPLIRALKAFAPHGMDMIIDAPPGASCPAATAVRGCDFALLVCEPTPFGVNDMSIVVEMLQDMRIPFAVTLNKAGVVNSLAESYCVKNRIQTLGRLHEKREVAELLSKGGLLSKSSASYMRFFDRLAMAVRTAAMEGGRNAKAV